MSEFIQEQLGGSGGAGGAGLPQVTRTISVEFIGASPGFAQYDFRGELRDDVLFVCAFTETQAACAIAKEIPPKVPSTEGLFACATALDKRDALMCMPLVEFLAAMPAPTGGAR